MIIVILFGEEWKPLSFLFLQVSSPSCYLRLLGPSAPCSAPSLDFFLCCNYKPHLSSWNCTLLTLVSVLLLSVSCFEWWKPGSWKIAFGYLLYIFKWNKDLGISRWDGLPTFPLVCMGLLWRLKLHRWFFRYYHPARFAMKNETSYRYYN